MRWWLVAWLVASGCPKPEIDAEQVAFDAALADADRAWTERGRIGLDGVERAIERAAELRPTDPEVLWRRARLQVAEAIVAHPGREARRGFATARATAIECLRGERQVARLLQDGLVAEAAEAVTVRRASCVAWAAHAWIRWAGTLEREATRVDHASIRSLLDRAARDPNMVVRDIWTWSEALWAARTGDSPAAGVDVVRELVTVDHDDAWVRYDDARSAGLDASRAPRRPPRTPEERAVEARTQKAP